MIDPTNQASHVIFREATLQDYKGLHAVRIAVTENRLSNPLRITEADYALYLTERGKGWLCEIANEVVGFAIVDTIDNNIWALFVHPTVEGRGIGKRLQQIMLDWFFHQSTRTLWLSTGQGTKAERFYELTGWKRTGTKTSDGEIKFEMALEDWQKAMQ